MTGPLGPTPEQSERHQYYDPFNEDDGNHNHPLEPKWNQEKEPNRKITEKSGVIPFRELVREHHQELDDGPVDQEVPGLDPQDESSESPEPEDGDALEQGTDCPVRGPDLKEHVVGPMATGPASRDVVHVGGDDIRIHKIQRFEGVIQELLHLITQSQ